MTLTFEDAGLFKERKWQCFCCGKNYSAFEEYKEHIVTSHEEGREWIKCQDCGAPVRDMKMHYKAKHPNRVMPTGIQTKVCVWMDFKPGGGKDKKGQRVKKRVATRQGTFTSVKCGRDFEYKSGLEESFLNMLEEDIDVENFCYEPFKVPYCWKGDWRNYIPDVRVNFIDGSTQIWEIKPEHEHEYELNKCKWAAAHNFCTNMGWEFIVQSEQILETYRWKIQRQRNEAKLQNGLNE